MSAERESPIRVVVTGGSGYLGQHIVKLLQQKCSLSISQITVFDRVPFAQKLGEYPSFFNHARKSREKRTCTFTRQVMVKTDPPCYLLIGLDFFDET